MSSPSRSFDRRPDENSDEQSDETRDQRVSPSSPEWSFSYEDQLHETFPALHEAERAFMSQIDSLPAPDRKTHELIRLVCTVAQRNHEGIVRNAGLAREVGASWEDVLGSVMLTVPAFGVLPAAEAISFARSGFDAAPDPEAD